MYMYISPTIFLFNIFYFLSCSWSEIEFSCNNNLFPTPTLTTSPFPSIDCVLHLDEVGKQNLVQCVV